MSDVEVIQVADGTDYTQRSRYGESKTVKIGREWSVSIDGHEIGRVRYGLITRERRGQGMRYVYARWQSPGWKYQESDGHYWFERPSKKGCVETLVREWERSK